MCDQGKALGECRGGREKNEGSRRVRETRKDPHWLRVSAVALPQLREPRYGQGNWDW